VERQSSELEVAAQDALVAELRAGRPLTMALARLAQAHGSGTLSNATAWLVHLALEDAARRELEQRSNGHAPALELEP
jgi:hypothetical protein